MSGTTVAFARVRVDAFRKVAGWDLTDISIVHDQWTLLDGTQPYLPRDRRGQPTAALEANCPSANPVGAWIQGARYAEQFRPS